MFRDYFWTFCLSQQLDVYQTEINFACLISPQERTIKTLTTIWETWDVFLRAVKFVIWTAHSNSLLVPFLFPPRYQVRRFYENTIRWKLVIEYNLLLTKTWMLSNLPKYVLRTLIFGNMILNLFLHISDMKKIEKELEKIKGKI